MLKRTKGRLLLTLLVVTGFAGTLNTASLSSKERKVIVAAIKDNKTELVKKLRGLSEVQAQALMRKDKGVLKTLNHIAATEASLWRSLEKAMQQPANPADRDDIQIRDEEVAKFALDAKHCSAIPGSETILDPSLPDLLNTLKTSQAKQLRYIKTTTEDLRNRVTDTPVGKMDCYQLLLYITRHTQFHLEQVAAITELTQPRPTAGK
jgi:hypothetical protein